MITPHCYVIRTLGALFHIISTNVGHQATHFLVVKVAIVPRNRLHFTLICSVTNSETQADMTQVTAAFSETTH
jgi:hypothetical protein